MKSRSIREILRFVQHQEDIFLGERICLAPSSFFVIPFKPKMDYPLECRAKDYNASIAAKKIGISALTIL